MSAPCEPERWGRLGPGGGGPAVLHPPAVDHWWWLDAGPAWWDGQYLWLVRGDAVWRAGAPVEPVNLPRGAERPPSLPWGAREARVWAALDDGWVWVSEGWVYRAFPVRAIGAGSRICAGSESVLIGDDEAFTHVAARGRSAVRLEVPIAGPRWEGAFPWGVHECAVKLDPVTGRIVGRRDGVPIGGGRTLDDLPWDLVDVPPAYRDGLLAGPGGVTWDLRTEQSLQEGPIWRDAATVATAGAWATVDLDGDGAWLDPRTGQAVEHFELPLDEDFVEAAWERDGAALFRTTLGHTWRVRGGDVERGTGEPPPPVHEVAVNGRRYTWPRGALLRADG